MSLDLTNQPPYRRGGWARKSDFVGVTYDLTIGNWLARFDWKGEAIVVGRYTTEMQAGQRLLLCKTLLVGLILGEELPTHTFPAHLLNRLVAIAARENSQSVAGSCTQRAKTGTPKHSLCDRPLEGR